MQRRLTYISAVFGFIIMSFGNPALADFAPVQREADFRALVEGRDLTRFGIRLQVLREGQITGRGFRRAGRR